MKKMNAAELHAIEGGRWKCTWCDEKFWTRIAAYTHCNCYAHYSGAKVGDYVKWCW